MNRAQMNVFAFSFVPSTPGVSGDAKYGSDVLRVTVSLPFLRAHVLRSNTIFSDPRAARNHDLFICGRRIRVGRVTLHFAVWK